MSVRTQVYLPENLYNKLRLRARSTGKSMAEQIRESIEQYLAKAEDRTVPVPDDPIWKLQGGIESGVGDLSTRHDEYLYGRDGGHGSAHAERQR